MKMRSQDPPAMPALIPTVKKLSNLSDSKLQKQMFLVKQLKTMLEKEKWKLARLLGEFHSRNRMKKIQEIEEQRKCQKKISYDSMTMMQTKRRQLHNSTNMTSSPVYMDSTTSTVGANSWYDQPSKYQHFKSNIKETWRV